jgi:hypothetical protein
MRRCVPCSAIITRFSNEVPTTDTMPRTLSGRAPSAGVCVLDAGGTGETGVVAGVLVVGTAGGPATIVESRGAPESGGVAAESALAPPRAQPAAKQAAITNFLISFS